MSSYHSETVAYYLARAREALREASAAHRRREVPKPAETPPAQPETVIEPVTDGPVEYRDPGTQEWKPCPPDMPTPYTAEEPA